MTTREQTLERIVEKIVDADKILFYTGAGTSVHSGIPDFRSPGGLWERYNPIEVATIDAFKRNPEKVWDFLKEVYKKFSDPQPNKAHYTITEIQKIKGRENVYIATQNIDGLHQNSGSVNVFEIHGSPDLIHCLRCLYEEEFNYEKHVEIDTFPLCPKCGKPLKPKITLFGEAINPHTFKSALRIARKSDIIIGVATSLEIFPAADIFLSPPPKVKKALFNLTATYYDKLIHYKIRGDIIDTLPELLTEIKKKMK